MLIDKWIRENMEKACGGHWNQMYFFYQMYLVMDLAVWGFWLDSLILEVFSNLNSSMISCSEQSFLQ